MKNRRRKEDRAKKRNVFSKGPDVFTWDLARGPDS